MGSGYAARSRPQIGRTAADVDGHAEQRDPLLYFRCCTAVGRFVVNPPDVLSHTSSSQPRSPGGLVITGGRHPSLVNLVHPGASRVVFRDIDRQPLAAGVVICLGVHAS